MAQAPNNDIPFNETAQNWSDDYREEVGDPVSAAEEILVRGSQGPTNQREQRPTTSLRRPAWISLAVLGSVALLLTSVQIGMKARQSNSEYAKPVTLSGNILARQPVTEPHPGNQEGEQRPEAEAGSPAPKQKDNSNEAADQGASQAKTEEVASVGQSIGTEQAWTTYPDKRGSVEPASYERIRPWEVDKAPVQPALIPRESPRRESYEAAELRWRELGAEIRQAIVGRGIDGVDVTFIGDTAYLKGNIRTENERFLAEQTARSYPEVEYVRNWIWRNR